ncbi:helix-turn-helix transcriptional regulator [Marinomonas sp. M1K-6]|uniref:Helix-turn-helix transcriptional regulator n=2 Tax=Marinomonas profundi TaxID=2726122 RepID=A0A847R1Z9_9GAMM|nr:helix-turn-helix transcriptional regulator [Marinomonas profundi]
MSQFILDAESTYKPLSSEPQLIQSLYAALTKKEGFHIFLNQIASAINACAAELVVVKKAPLQISHIWYSGLSAEFMEWYISNNMIENDLVSNNAIHCQPGLFQTALSLIEQVKHLPDYGRWQQDQNMIDSAWLVIDNTKTHTTFVAIQRTVEQGAYQQAELTQLNRLVPYIKQAVFLYQKLDKTNSLALSLANLVDALPNPSVILNERSELLYSNKKAERLLAKHDQLTIKNNRLEFKERQHQQSFFTASTQIIRASMGQDVLDNDVIILKNKNIPLLTMTLSPIEGGGILVTLYDCNKRSMPAPALIAAYFNLSPAESTLCANLILGMSLKEIAESRFKSEATIRSQLKQIFPKAGVNRQGQLICTILMALMR